MSGDAGPGIAVQASSERVFPGQESLGRDPLENPVETIGGAAREHAGRGSLSGALLSEELGAAARQPAPGDARPWGPLSWGTTGSPVGTLLLVVSELGVVRVGLPGEDVDALLGELARAAGRAPERSAEATAPVARQLREYFDGARRAFDVPADLRLSTPFRQRVQRAMLRIGYGRTVSYGQLARMAGAGPGAARAVGGACSHNPVPLIVPCHRVLPAGGGVGSYRGGPAMKRRLLALEGHGPDLTAPDAGIDTQIPGTRAPAPGQGRAGHGRAGHGRAGHGRPERNGSPSVPGARTPGTTAPEATGPGRTAQGATDLRDDLADTAPLEVNDRER